LAEAAEANAPDLALIPSLECFCIGTPHAQLNKTDSELSERLLSKCLMQFAFFSLTESLFRNSLSEYRQCLVTD